MNLRATAVLLLIAVGLGLWVWFGETGGGAGDPATRKLVPVEIDEVTALELPLKDGGRVRLVRVEADAWALEIPIAHPAAGEQVADLLRGVTRLETRARLSEVGEDRTPFGLDAASALVRVEAGDRTYVLRLGRETPFGGDQYVSIEGDEAVYTVASRPVRSRTTAWKPRRSCSSSARVRKAPCGSRWEATQMPSICASTAGTRSTRSRRGLPKACPVPCSRCATSR